MREIISLMGAYSMEVQLERPQEAKIRFAGMGTFIDVWNGKKGLTLGVYHRKAGAMEYFRRAKTSKIEDILIKIQKEYYAASKE